ncbi:MAG TPA: DUF262 domain-containing HNH endonuclease family protein [Solirubrobacteraceae bacterium]
MNARTQGVGELLEHLRHFTVPDHQRDYAWGEEEVVQLVDDVKRALEEQAPDYFVGLIVLVSPGSNGAWEILDGQQRLATVTMIYAAIREWLHAAGFERDATMIQAEHIGVLSLGEAKDSPRLVLNINDRAIFQELVVDRASDETITQRRDEFGRYSSQRKVAQAALTCRVRIRDFARDSGTTPDDQANALYRFANYLRENVKVVSMNVSSETNAYVIFESLNDRGLDLSVLDLVKNHLFGRSGTHLELVKKNWAQMVAHLGDRSADDFLKVFWTSRYGRIQRGKLFQEWRERFDGLKAADVVKLTADLIIAADRFAALDSGDDELWKDFPPSYRVGLQELIMLGNRQMRPVIMAALNRFSKQDMDCLVNVLVVATFRYQTVGRRRTGAIEITAARAAFNVAQGASKSTADIWSQFASLIPNDEEFEEDFPRYAEPKPTIAKYVLRRLEVMARQQKDGKTPDIAPVESLTLEHILPENPGAGWQTLLESDPEVVEHFARFGNLCLLPRKQNKLAGNDSFVSKAGDMYSKSELLLTREIPERWSDWDRATIRQRGERLGKLAAMTWRANV